MANQAATATGIIKTADKTAEGAAQSSIDQTFLPGVDLTVPSTPEGFIEQSQDIAQAAFTEAGVARARRDVAATGRKAAKALDIVDQRFIDEERAKLPLAEMQASVQDLQANRMRVLPDILADPTIKDFRSKLRIA
jgi:hypothetical protein